MFRLRPVWTGIHRLVTREKPGIAVVHIGVHKTGTTSFQKSIHLAKQRLSNNGVFVAADENSGLSTVLAQLVLRQELVPPFRLANPDLLLQSRQIEFEEHLSRQIATRHPVVLFSHEALSFVRTKVEVRRLRKLLAPRRAHIVVTLRETQGFLASWRAQILRNGFAETSRRNGSWMNTEPDSWLANFESLLSVYRDEFGRGNVTVVDYDEELRRRGDVVPAVWEACGLPKFDDIGNGSIWENRTPSP